MAKTYKEYLKTKAGEKEIKDLTSDEVVTYAKEYLAENDYSLKAFNEISYMSILRNHGLTDEQQNALRAADINHIAEEKGAAMDIINGYVSLLEAQNALAVERESVAIQSEEARKAIEELELYKKANPDKVDSVKVLELERILEERQNNLNALHASYEDLEGKLANKEKELQEAVAANERLKTNARVEVKGEYEGKIADLEEKNKKQEKTIEETKGKAKKRGIAAILAGGLLAASITGGIINGIHDENQIRDLENQIKGLNQTNQTYITEIEGLNQSLTDINVLYAELQKENEALKAGFSINDNAVTADELITAFAPLVDAGVITQEQVNSLKNEDGTIDLSILVNVDESGYLYSLAMDKIENDTFKKAISDSLNSTLEVVGVKVKDKDGNQVNATVDHFTDNEGYVDSIAIIEEINDALVDYRNNLLTVYETISGMSKDGTVSLTTETLQSLNTLRDVTEAMVDSAEDAVEAYNAIVEDNKQLEAQLSDAEAVKDAMQSEIDEKDDIIAGKDAEIAEKDDIIADKDKEIAEKDDIIAEKDAQITEKDEIIESQDKQIDDLENSINNGVGAGATGDSNESQSGQIPATPSGDSEQDQENNKKPNQNEQGSSNNNQGTPELGG